MSSAKIDLMKKSIPKSRLTLYERCLAGRASPRAAIKAFCQQCVGYGDIPQAIIQCTATGCPLYVYRPYQKRGADAATD